MLADLMIACAIWILDCAGGVFTFVITAEPIHILIILS